MRCRDGATPRRRNACLLSRGDYNPQRPVMLAFRRSMLRFLPSLLLLVVATTSFAQSRICIDHDTITFGDRPVGTSATVKVTVSSCGSAPFRFTDVSVYPSTGAAFSIDSTCATGMALPAGESCAAVVRFAPTTAGQQSGALWLRNTTSTPTQLVTFYGRGTSAAAGTSSLAFSPALLQFDDTALGTTSASVRLELQNRGAAAITPSALVLNGPAAYDFNGSGDCAVGRAIPAGGSCHLDMVFTPGALGSRIANLNVDAPQLASLAILRLAGTGVAASVSVLPPAVDIVEFHHTALDHYFLTADPGEIAMIDAGGLGSAWSRTGRSFHGWSASIAATGAVDACRFFGTPGLGPASHFYTVDSGECAAVKNDAFWTYEGIAFRVLPLSSAGACPTGVSVVQRLYKPAADVTGIRHRYVTSADDVEAMKAAGWMLEGPVFCSAP